MEVKSKFFLKVRMKINYALYVSLIMFSVPISLVETTSSRSTTENVEFTSKDIVSMAKFIADFVQHLRIYSLCVASTPGSSDLSKSILAALSSYMVFTSPCCVVGPNQNFTKICSAYNQYSTSSWQHAAAKYTQPLGKNFQEKSSNKSIPYLAEITLTSRNEIDQAVDLVLDRYDMTNGAVTQIILGFDLMPYGPNVPYTARWILSCYHKKNQSASIYEVYSFTDDRDGLWIEMGKWQESVGVSLSHMPGEVLADFKGHTVRMAFFPYPPYVIMGKKCRTSPTLHGTRTTFQYDPTCTDGPPKHSVTKELYVGYLIDLVESLAGALNFTYSLIHPENEQDFVFGVGEADNYTGLVGMIAAKEADIILASLTYSRGRIKVIDFSTNVDYFVRNLYIRADAVRSAVGWGTYIMSFDKWTWLSIVLIHIITSIAFWILIGKEQNPPGDIVTFHDILFMFFSCTMQQGTPSAPESYQGRVVFWIFWFTSVILYASYTAVLTSYLTVSTESQPFSTLAGAVAKYPNWKVGILEGTPLRQLVEDSDGEEYHILSRRLQEDPSVLVLSDNQGIDRALTENYAYFADAPFLKYLLRDNCSITEIPVGLFFAYGHLGISKNLPFANVIDREILKMSDAGVMDRMYRHWWSPKKPCKEPEAFTELGFSHTITAFLILLLGIIISVVSLVSEVLYSRGKKKKNKGKEQEQVQDSTRSALSKRQLTAR